MRGSGVGAKFLFAYYNVGPAPADVVARLTSNVTLDLAGVVQVVASPGDVSVVLDAALSIMGPEALLSLGLHSYGAGNQNLVAPARPRRWLVVAIGAGGGGGGQGANGSAGGAASLTGDDVTVRASGGPGGRKWGSGAAESGPALGGGSVTGSRVTGRVVTGAGAAGGIRARTAQSSTTGALDGGAGALAIALVTPDPGATYAVAVGSPGAGGTGSSTGGPGGAAALFVLEFLPTG